jgi:hypothetical protein
VRRSVSASWWARWIATDLLAVFSGWAIGLPLKQHSAYQVRVTCSTP